MANYTELLEYAHSFVVRRYGCQVANREDLVQDALLIAIPKIESGTARFPERIVRSAVIFCANDELKKRGRKKREVACVSLDEDRCEDKSFYALNSDPSIKMASDELLSSVREQLNDRERKIVDLRIYGFTDDEIAKRIGISRPRIVQIRKRIATKLNKSHIISEAFVS